MSYKKYDTKIWIRVRKYETIDSHSPKKSDFNNVDDIDFKLTKNEEIVQNSNTSLMLWKIDELIEYISKFFTLKIGDVIFTGTPSGVGKVNLNDNLKGYMNDKELLSINVK